ncbi:MAG: aldo/keto reductase [Alphaproteobacteria bacterium]|nr:aldo/keto reductase [Alphaproteobacteria bacterium]
MKQLDLARIPRPVSHLALGMSDRDNYEQAAPILDTFHAAGGTLFDTAFQYGRADTVLGQWLTARGLTDAVTVIGKGCHTPDCRPDRVAPQLEASLDALQRGCLDIYFLHRDDPAVPVEEWVDAIDPHVRAGRIRRYGGSNWTTARIDAANQYASRTGKAGFSALSNQFSLAEMIAPPWDGCRSAGDAASIDWLKRTATPLFAWSSQARGFFTDRAIAARPPDPELVRCWHSPAAAPGLWNSRHGAGSRWRGSHSPIISRRISRYSH